MTDPHTPQLGDALKAERRSRRLSLRDVSDATGVSVNTLSRVERGHLPDLKNYQRLVDWLGVPADTFLETTQPESSAGTLDLVARHFRSDQRLTPDAAAKLTSMVQDMYNKLVSERPRLAVHMRSAKTFTPAAGAVLADILSDMQATLDAEETG
ncbi:MAG TPA: helix-turn-helix transcriptional regulator [Streptosporangiaceae bacterium]|nr:helix-turn-helix transcriptional regulator [Streptosporangiaceae bacterium]